MMTGLKERYQSEIGKAMMDSGRYRNVMQLPKVEKVVVNIGVNTSVDRDALKTATEEIARITGQRPIVTKAKKSVANFKLREGSPIGAKVTLRGSRMYDFLDRLINVALPRIRDFRGISSKSFDGRGNYSLGLDEQTIFPEINPDHVKRAQGMDVTIVTTAETDDEARQLLQLMGMPFAKA